MLIVRLFMFFFFQAEDGIRGDLVTGVQTCALPIYKAVMRHTSLNGLIDALKHNTARKNANLAFYEVGSKYLEEEKL